MHDKPMKKIIIPLSCIVVIFTISCQHKPVYPDYGSIYIYSSPNGAEILLDNENTNRKTPAKIDGLTVGDHDMYIRMNGYQAFRKTVNIKPAETLHAFCDLTAITFSNIADVPVSGLVDAVLDITTERLYVISYNKLNERAMLYIYQVSESAIVLQVEKELDFIPEMLAIGKGLNYLYCLGSMSGNKVLKAFDNSTLEGKGEVISLDVQDIHKIYYTPDGSTLIATDIKNNRLLHIDPVNNNVSKAVNLSISPDDLSFNPINNELFAIDEERNRFSKIDINTGEELIFVTTPSSPHGIFWNANGTMAGVWNKYNKSVTLINFSSWAVATGFYDVGGDVLTYVCWSHNPEYLLSLVVKVEVSDGKLLTVYLPSWNATSRVEVGWGAFKIIICADPEKLIIVDNLGGVIRYINYKI